MRLINIYPYVNKVKERERKTSSLIIITSELFSHVLVLPKMRMKMGERVKCGGRKNTERKKSKANRKVLCT